MKILGILLAGLLSFSSQAYSSDLTIEVASDVQTQQYLSYNFGRVWVNSMNTVVYNIRNNGQVAIERERFSVSGMYFDAYTNCPRTMAPGTRCELEIRYWPSFEGHHFGRMQMLFTDRNDIIIDLYGDAFRM